MRLKWHPFTYIVHYFKKNAVHYIGNRLPFQTHPKIPGPALALFSIQGGSLQKLCDKAVGERKIWSGRERGTKSG